MDEYIGIVKVFGGNFAPKGWAFCNGQLLAIAQNQALFAILGTTYGGDGITTFALPDFRGRAAMGAGQGPGLSTHVLGEAAGTETVTLNNSNLPPHNHLVMASNQDSSLADPTGAVWGKEPQAVTFIYSANNPDTTMNPAAIGMSGGNQPHQNMQPYLAITYIICLQGYFPSRN